MILNLSRREALKSAGGLILGVAFPISPEFLHYGPESDASTDWLGPYVRIDPQGVITLRVPASEMGQGVHTALPMILAEELDIPLDGVRVEMAPNSKAYGHPSQLGSQQVTVGSGSLRGWWAPMALAGATARAMLVGAAAKRWGVTPEECQTAGGAVISGSNRATYGELAVEAAAMPVGKATPKSRGDWRLIGTEPERVDVPSKIDGSAVFGVDVMAGAPAGTVLSATVLHSPIFGASLVSVDDAEARKLPGVLDVLTFKAKGRTQDFIAIVADTFWHARVAAASVVAKWEGGRPDLDDAAISKAIHAGLDAKAHYKKKEGDAAGAIAGAGTLVEAVYEVPYLHHATMEPLCATARVTADRVEIWAPSQSQTLTEGAVADALGVPKASVRLHTTLLGGGLGRKSEVDFVVEAARIAEHYDKPVKVIWTREEDFTHGYYRPAFAAKMRAGVSRVGDTAPGTVTGLSVRLSGPNILTRFVSDVIGNLIRGSFVGENFHENPYHIPDQRLEYHQVELPIPTGFWRSVSASHNGYFRECFLDEIAHAAGVDPVKFRLDLLVHSPRHRAVVERAAAMARWDAAKAEGRHLGIAVVESFGSIVAQVAEVRVVPGAASTAASTAGSTGGSLHVDKVWIAFDCGRCIHPGIIRAQAEGSMGMGLSAAFGEVMSFSGGAAITPNFYAYPVLTLAQMPAVEVEVLEGAPDEPGGVGEPALPPIAPAVCNAIFAATGARIRKLPIALSGLGV
ncbi:MAG: xanthine dehydrogenase family protein molybdopterin-binding subunit [Myxococcales bacterium]|nr:xanthine dehydrogenase family protein molybdopterin-binding subunit [Myxococcales bacterium]